jgi:hypothetical protein
MFESALLALLAAAGGGLLAAVAFLYTWFVDMRRETASRFLSEGLAILAMPEAWILQG